MWNLRRESYEKLKESSKAMIEGDTRMSRAKRGEGGHAKRGRPYQQQSVGEDVGPY